MCQIIPALIESCQPGQRARMLSSRSPRREPISPIWESSQSRIAKFETGCRLSQDIESALRQLFTSAGVEIGYPTEFELAPVPELESRYESALGLKDWRRRAVELHIFGVSRAFALLIALVGAAVHRWVLGKGHSWRGPAQEYLGSKLRRQHVDRVVALHTK